MLPSLALSSRASTIGWIGLGAMGHHMAINLFTKTLLAHQSSSSSLECPTFAICEQDDSRAEAFVRDLREKGGSELAQSVKRVENGAQMAAIASRVVTMLPSTPQVEAVYLDAQSGILAGLKRLKSDVSRLASGTTFAQISAPTTDQLDIDTLLIDQTTLDPTAATRIASTIQDETQGRAVMLDAPVSGGQSPPTAHVLLAHAYRKTGIVAAAAGSLTIMFGSPSPVATEQARPLLQRMAREGGVIECGANGTGVGVKVCNNLILAINQIALAEGLALGRLLGIDPTLLHNVVNTSSGQSWSSRVNSPSPEIPDSPGSRGYTGGFQSRLMLKDVGLALHAAHTYDLPTPLTWAAKSVYDAVCSEGEGEWASKDFSVVYEWLKKKQEQGVERGWKDGPPSVL